MTDVLSDYKITARKHHVCDQCGHHIDPGQTYRRQCYKDGDIYVYKAHDDCDEAASEMHDMASLNAHDSILLLNDVQVDDSGWLWVRFPRVAERLGLTSVSWFEIWGNRYRF